ncbi:hypothetical protein RJ640_028007 [Escallonia rubra]|uniref:U-box domain-containing protein n=1 Tax=Escallonia rubra TaxID=112253 RepID=A0AA88U8V8_9ASTE|nr:hypothetical protein RJ640_028007 [Escallonia rubra]
MEEVTVEALLSCDREARILAARGIRNLTSKQRHRLAESGAIPPLVLMLCSQDYEAIEAALLALLTLAFGSERNKTRIAKSGAISVLLKILQCQNQVLVEHAIAALLVLSSCKANRQAIVASGAIQLLVEILDADDSIDSNNNTSLQAKLDILDMLHHLSTCSQIIQFIVFSGAVVSLLRLIYGSDKSSKLTEKAVALLEKIVSSSQDALRKTASTDGAIQGLVEIVEDGSRQSQEHAVGILLLICQSCRDRYRGLILTEGAMPGLLQLSGDGTRRAKEMANALLLLLRDCSGPGLRKKQPNNDFLEEVMRHIDRGGKDGTGLRLVEEMIAKLRT